MKKVVDSVVHTEVLVDQLDGREVVAYRCSNSENGNVAVLCKLTRDSSNYKFGFINLGNPTSGPTFISTNFYDSIKFARIQSRPVFVFANQSELIEAIYNKKI